MLIRLPSTWSSQILVSFDANKGQGAGGRPAAYRVQMCFQQAWSREQLPYRGSAEGAWNLNLGPVLGGDFY